MKRTCMFSLRMFGFMLFLVLVSRSAWVSAETYNVGVLDFPPFYIVKSETEVEGTMADLLRKIMDKAGMKYVMKGYPPKRLYKELAEGSTQIWMGVKGVPEYEGQVIYGDSEINEIEIRLYTLEGKPLLNTLPETKGQKIITIRGYSYGGMINYLTNPENAISLDPSDSHELAFKKLIKGRGDYVLDYKRPAEEAIKANAMTGLAHSVLKNIKIHLVVSKKTPDAENVLKKMEDAFKALKKEGAI